MLFTRVEDSTVQLKDRLSDLDALYNAVTDFYFVTSRRCLIFESKSPGAEGQGDYFVRFLLDGKHVVEYRIAEDRGTFLSIVSLAIGPHYFSPGDFWDYKNSQRFTLEASTDAVSYNLNLLDEFFDS
jgi:hypothetical protein